MQEILFTENELEKIQKEASDPVYIEKNLVHLGQEKLSIREVDAHSGLILPYGNEWTGFKHISDRHSATSLKPHWKANNKLDNPTKFILTFTPFQYLNSIKQIFNPECLNLEKNKNPTKFDIYVGECIQPDNAKRTYLLATYKNTKIIHTFYLLDNKKPYNKNKILNLSQGRASASHDLIKCIQTFSFQYYNQKNIPLFKVIQRFNEVEKSLSWYIQVNLDDGTASHTNFVKKEMNVINQLPAPFQMTNLDFSDMFWIERIIKKMLTENNLCGNKIWGTNS